MNRMIRLGLLGMSKGNGHPYSWSAIFNGYDQAALAECGFPVISQYLSERRFPQDAIAGAHVIHIWTQDREVSEHVAEAVYIDNIVEDYMDLVGQVDAVLLARDDAENHFEMSKPFLAAGIPVYIDKPLALSIDEAKSILRMQQCPGQVFSCSAMRYASELSPREDEFSSLGTVAHLHGMIAKDWDKYAVHIVEPALKLVGEQGRVVKSARFEHGDATVVNIVWESGLHGTFSTLGRSTMPLSLTIVGAASSLTLSFQNTFTAFKAALEAFVPGVQQRRPTTPESCMLSGVEVIEAGRRATRTVVTH